jgi:hypothetical protein
LLQIQDITLGVSDFSEGLGDLRFCWRITPFRIACKTLPMVLALARRAFAAAIEAAILAWWLVCNSSTMRAASATAFSNAAFDMMPSFAVVTSSARTWFHHLVNH